MEKTKKPALLIVCRILGEQKVPYALIGGLAVQVHRSEPRTTLDIDIAVISRDAIPRESLEAAGMQFRGSFDHSDNWLSADGTPIQFSADPSLAASIRRSASIELDEVTIRVITVEDLLHEKLRAGSDAGRRRSKRLQDLSDAEGILEERPELASTLSAEERAILDRLPS